MEEWLLTWAIETDWNVKFKSWIQQKIRRIENFDFLIRQFDLERQCKRTVIPSVQLLKGRDSECSIRYAAAEKKELEDVVQIDDGAQAGSGWPTENELHRRHPISGKNLLTCQTTYLSFD